MELDYGTNWVRLNALPDLSNDVIYAAGFVSDNKDVLWFDLFPRGQRLIFCDHGQSCCENRYMVVDDDVQKLVGARILKVEVVDADYHGDDDSSSVHEEQFMHITTTLGPLTVVSHNEHNGYYGGISCEAAFIPVPSN